MEKSVRILSVLLSVFAIAPLSFAADPFLDNEFKQYEDEYWAGFEVCLKLKSTPKRTACDEENEKKFANDSRNRRSRAYFNAHYKTLNSEQLEGKLLELKVMKKNAPRIVVSRDRPHGVVSQKILAAEISQIHALQTERDFATRCEEDKKRTVRLQLSLYSIEPDCKQYFAEKAVEKRMKGQGGE